jgi:hypothetical protein
VLNDIGVLFTQPFCHELVCFQLESNDYDTIQMIHVFLFGFCCVTCGTISMTMTTFTSRKTVHRKKKKLWNVCNFTISHCIDIHQWYIITIMHGCSWTNEKPWSKTQKTKMCLHDQTKICCSTLWYEFTFVKKGQKQIYVLMCALFDYVKKNVWSSWLHVIDQRKRGKRDWKETTHVMYQYFTFLLLTLLINEYVNTNTINSNDYIDVMVSTNNKYVWQVKSKICW